MSDQFPQDDGATSGKSENYGAFINEAFAEDDIQDNEASVPNNPVQSDFVKNTSESINQEKQSTPSIDLENKTDEKLEDSMVSENVTNTKIPDCDISAPSTPTTPIHSCNTDQNETVNNNVQNVQETCDKKELSSEITTDSNKLAEMPQTSCSLDNAPEEATPETEVTHEKKLEDDNGQTTSGGELSSEEDGEVFSEPLEDRDMQKLSGDQLADLPTHFNRKIDPKPPVTTKTNYREPQTRNSSRTLAPPRYSECETQPPVVVSSGPGTDFKIGLQQDSAVRNSSRDVNQFQFAQQPVLCECPYCHCNIETHTSFRIGCYLISLSIVLCIIRGIICMLICLLIDDAYDVVHYCPNCGEKLGTNKKEGCCC